MTGEQGGEGTGSKKTASKNCWGRTWRNTLTQPVAQEGFWVALMVSYSENNVQSLSHPPLSATLPSSPKQKGLAEKGFLGGFVSPSSRDQCERSFPPILINIPTNIPGISNPWLFQPRNPSSTAAVTSPHNKVHMTRLVSTQTIVIFRQASRAQKQTTALFKRHYGPGRTGRCSTTCTLGPGASKWYSAFGNLPSFSKLLHGGWVPTDTIIKHHHRLQCD